MPLPKIEKMPLNEIEISPEQQRYLSLFFADIMKRGATKGNLNDMMLEAYILGFYDCMKVLNQFDTQETTKPSEAE